MERKSKGNRGILGKRKGENVHAEDDPTNTYIKMYNDILKRKRNATYLIAIYFILRHIKMLIYNIILLVAFLFRFGI